MPASDYRVADAVLVTIGQGIQTVFPPAQAEKHTSLTVHFWCHAVKGFALPRPHITFAFSFQGNQQTAFTSFNKEGQLGDTMQANMDIYPDIVDWDKPNPISYDDELFHRIQGEWAQRSGPHHPRPATVLKIALKKNATPLLSGVGRPLALTTAAQEQYRALSWKGGAFAMCAAQTLYVLVKIRHDERLRHFAAEMGQGAMAAPTPPVQLIDPLKAYDDMVYTKASTDSAMNQGAFEAAKSVLDNFHIPQPPSLFTSTAAFCGAFVTAEILESWYLLAQASEIRHRPATAVFEESDENSVYLATVRVASSFAQSRTAAFSQLLAPSNSCGVSFHSPQDATAVYRDPRDALSWRAKVLAHDHSGGAFAVRLRVWRPTPLQAIMERKGGPEAVYRPIHPGQEVEVFLSPTTGLPVLLRKLKGFVRFIGGHKVAQTRWHDADDATRMAAMWSSPAWTRRIGGPGEQGSTQAPLAPALPSLPLGSGQTAPHLPPSHPLANMGTVLEVPFAYSLTANPATDQAGVLAKNILVPHTSTTAQTIPWTRLLCNAPFPHEVASVHLWGTLGQDAQDALSALVVRESRQDFLAHIQACPGAFMTIVGPAGSTKTFQMAVASIGRVLQGKTVIGVAPTNVAVGTLADKLALVVGLARENPGLAQPHRAALDQMLIIHAYGRVVEVKKAVGFLLDHIRHAHGDDQWRSDPKWNPVSKDDLEQRPDPDIWQRPMSLAEHVLQLIGVVDGNEAAMEAIRAQPPVQTAVRCLFAELGQIASMDEDAPVDKKQNPPSWCRHAPPPPASTDEDTTGRQLARFGPPVFLDDEDDGDALLDYTTTTAFGHVGRLARALLLHADIVVSTPHVATDHWIYPFTASATDLLIDEAGFTTIAEAIQVWSPRECVIISGDPKQISPPVFSGGESLSHGHQTTDANPLSLFVSHSLLDCVIKSGWPVLLQRTQARMAPGGFEVVRRLSYHLWGIQHAANNTLSTRPLAALVETWSTMKGARASPAHAVLPTFVNAEHTECKQAKIGKSRYNHGMTTLVVKTIIPQLFDFAAATDTRLALSDITVIAPYKAEVAVLREALAGRNKGKPVFAQVHVSTIDGALSRDNKIVIFVTTSTHATEPGFLQNAKRMTVAMSRHTDALIVVGDGNLFATRTYAALKCVWSFFTETGRIVRV